MLIRNITREDIVSIKKIKTSLSDVVIYDRFNLQEKGLVDFIILLHTNKPVGFVLLRWQGKETHLEYPDIEDLYIAENHRGKKFGTLLIKECEKRVKESGFSKIGLAVNPKLNFQAKKLYEKLGYYHDGKKSYVDGIYNGTEDRVVDLEKEL
ncbi:MAG: GNAT family N-acetyltransferase [Candidatus Roizmanbacteria bacterium]|nr:GNAT family N-acetyltransferase [Candidatus Roizmanbacteria bacterium]